VEKMSELSEFQKWVGEWGNETFNPKRGNNSKAIVHHLEKEVCELMDSNSPEEAADCFILLLHHAHALGYDLLDEARKKMEINKERQWGLPDENGVVEHVKEGK
jgi:predicted house-cleaning noncanonical NTP pyrophosphatase (MazG superfamily)